MLRGAATLRLQSVTQRDRSRAAAAEARYQGEAPLLHGGQVEATRSMRQPQPQLDPRSALILHYLSVFPLFQS